MTARMPAAGWLLLAAWACLLGGGGGQRLVVTRGADTADLIGQTLEVRTMVGSANPTVSLTVGWEPEGSTMAQVTSLSREQQASWLRLPNYSERNLRTAGATFQLSLTLRTSSVEAGVHEATLTFEHRFQGAREQAGQPGQPGPAGGFQWTEHESSVTVRFTVAEPSYSILSIPQEASGEVVAGTTTTRTFLLYNVLGQRLAWRCTAEAPEWLAPVGDCFGVAAVQQATELSLTITAPNEVPDETLLHTGTLESWESADAGTDAEPGEAATFDLDVQFRITVVPGEMDAAQSDFVWQTPVEAGDPMAVGVMPRDQHGNDISTAGLSFTMTLSAGGATAPLLEEISRFDPDEARYRIEVAEMPVQGNYEMAVSFSGEEGQAVAILKDGADSAAVAIDAKTCADGSLSAIGICLDCGAGQIPSYNASFCGGRLACCRMCPPFSSPSADKTACECDNNYLHNQTRLGLQLSEEEQPDGSKKDVNGQTYVGSLCMQPPCCDPCPKDAVCRRGSRVFADVGMWLDSTGEHFGKPFTVVHCLPRNCPGYCFLRQEQGLDSGRDTGCIDIRPHPEAKLQWQDFDLHFRNYSATNVNSCRQGSTGLACSTCKAGYRKVEGTCVRCERFAYGAIAFSIFYYFLAVGFFIHKSKRIVTGVDCDMHNSSSLVGITVFFLQTLVLLPRQGLHLGVVGDGFEALQDSLSLWPDSPDQDDGDCLSSGLFALDYFAKYSVPAIMMGATVGMSRLLGLKKAQQRMAMVFTVQFSLFPVIMRSISLAFCRDDMREKAGIPMPVASWWQLLFDSDDPALDTSANRLRLDPDIECSGAEYYLAWVVAMCVFVFCTVVLPVHVYRLMRRKMDEHEKLLRIQMYMQWGFVKGSEMIRNNPTFETIHSAEFAAQDYMSILYYPLRRDRFWWAIVWMLRLPLIAIVYSARDRRTQVTFNLADWRVLAVVILMIYNTVQAVVRPFKHSNESQLDAFSVLVLLMMFVMSLNLDMMLYNEQDVDAALRVLMTILALVVMLLVVVATYFSKRKTDATITRLIARQRWQIAWNNMSDNSDPLADVVRDTANDQQGGLAACLKKVGHVTKGLRKSLGLTDLSKDMHARVASQYRQKLPVFEQIDVDLSGEVDVDEFLGWWHLRTIRTKAASDMRTVATELFHRYDTDNSGHVCRSEFEGILRGLREWHAEEKAKAEAALPSLAERQVQMVEEKAKVVAHIAKIEQGAVDPRARSPRAPPSGLGQVLTNPLAADAEAPPPPPGDDVQFEVESAGGGGAAGRRALPVPAPRPTPPRRRAPSIRTPSVAVDRSAALPPTTPRDVDGAPALDGFTMGVLQSLTPPASPAADAPPTAETPTVAQIFDEIDADASGTISCPELCDWWRGNGGDEELLPKMEEAFGIVEYRDGVAGVSLSEFEECVLVLALDDWESTVDASGRKYYLNRVTQQSSWKEPGGACVADFLKAAGISRSRPVARGPPPSPLGSGAPTLQLPKRRKAPPSPATQSTAELPPPPSSDAGAVAAAGSGMATATLMAAKAKRRARTAAVSTPKAATPEKPKAGLALPARRRTTAGSGASPRRSPGRRAPTAI